MLRQPCHAYRNHLLLVDFSLYLSQKKNDFFGMTRYRVFFLSKKIFILKSFFLDLNYLPIEISNYSVRQVKIYFIEKKQL